MNVGSDVFINVNKIDPAKRSTIQCYRKENDIVKKVDTSQPTQTMITVQDVNGMELRFRTCKFGKPK